jgi:hypothetical protein
MEVRASKTIKKDDDISTVDSNILKLQREKIELAGTNTRIKLIEMSIRLGVAIDAVKFLLEMEMMNAKRDQDKKAKQKADENST